MSYTFSYLVYWSFFGLVLLGSIASIVIGAVLRARDDNSAALAVGLPVGIVGLLISIFVRTHGPRVRVRAGIFSFGESASPRTEEELRDAVKRFENPTLVGSSWTFFLKRAYVPYPRIYLNRYKGRDPTTRRWRSGTTIHELAETVLKESDCKKTLCTYPTMDYISIGAWLAMGNHGNGGDVPPNKSSDNIKDVRVLDMSKDDADTNVETMSVTEMRKKFDDKDYRKNHCILDVKLVDELVDNILIQKRGIVINSSNAAAEWLNKRAYLRVMFQGYARPYAIGLRWEKVYDVCAHRDPHFCSICAQYTQLDTFSVFCGWHEPMRRYNGIVSRHDANRWMPLILPIQVSLAAIVGMRNFEIIFKWPELSPINGSELFSLSQALIQMHKRVGGRSEIRHGSPDGPVFVDIALRHSFSEPFKMLNKQFKVKTVALHLGKAEMPTAPCTRVALSQL